jgi:3-dehydroquinate synthase
MEKVQVKSRDKTYDILIESGLFQRLPEIFKVRYHGKKLAVVCDTHIYPLYGESFVQKLRHGGFDVVPIIFEAGEKHKSLESLTQIYACLAEGLFTRSDILIALGGGVTGDMTGLAAATFLRGMGFIQIPTSLLAMVDSSVGGKVAVDLPQGKNLVGAFYQPDAVYTDPDFLLSLPDNELINGMGELIKAGMIRDAQLFDTLVQLAEGHGADTKGVLNPSLRQRLNEKLEYLIMRCCQIKRDIVEADEFDNDLRQLLNFGHTLGHAIERVQNYQGLSHGEAVAVGMAAFTRMTEAMGLTVKGETDKLIHVLKLYGLPTCVPDLCKEEVLKAIRIDKKNRSGMITIAYIERIGLGRLHSMNLEELEERIDGVLTHICKAS